MQTKRGDIRVVSDTALKRLLQMHRASTPSFKICILYKLIYRVLYYTKSHLFIINHSTFHIMTVVYVYKYNAYGPVY